MGGAIAESTTDNDFFYLCPECDYDLGEDFSNMTEDSCPECDHLIEKSSLTRGSANTAIQLRGIDEDDDNEIPAEWIEGEEVRIEQRLDAYLPYRSFNPPHGYQWRDVEDWRVHRQTIHITFRSGMQWSDDLCEQGPIYEESGDYNVYDADGDDLCQY